MAELGISYADLVIPEGRGVAEQRVRSVKARRLSRDLFKAVREGDTERQQEIIKELSVIFEGRPFIQKLSASFFDPFLGVGAAKAITTPFRLLRGGAKQISKAELRAFSQLPTSEATQALVHVPRDPLPPVQPIVEAPARTPPPYGRRPVTGEPPAIALPETTVGQPQFAGRPRTPPEVAELPSADPGRKLLYNRPTGSRALLPDLPASSLPADAPRPQARGTPPIMVEEPAPLLGNLLGFRTISSGLRTSDKWKNLARSSIGKPLRLARLNEITTPAFREHFKAQANIASQGNTFATKMERLALTFERTRTGVVEALAGVDPTLPGLPTIQDIAARLPRFWGRLTEQQRQNIILMRQLAEGEYGQLRDQYGVEAGRRADVVDGGFYLPRGMADEIDADAPSRFRTAGRRGGKAAFQRPALFDSMAHGIKEGYEYASFGEAMGSYAKSVGHKANDIRMANYMKTVRDEYGALIGSTPKLEAFKLDPQLVLRVERLRSQINALRSTKLRLGERMYDNFEKFLNDPEFDNIDGLSGTLRDMETRVKAEVKRGRLKGADIDQVSGILQRLGKELDDIRPEYKRLLLRATNIRGRGPINLSNLSNWTFADEVRDGANEILSYGDPLTGKPVLRQTIQAFRAFHHFYRGMTATGDNSYMGIQGLLGAYDNPKAAQLAFRASLASWGRKGDEVLGAFFNDFDNMVTPQGRPSVRDWSSAGLPIEPGAGEFGFTGALGRLPGFRQANRAFGVAGTTQRLRWADDEIVKQIANGRSVREIVDSGDFQRIAEAVAAMTGQSQTRTFSDVGEFVLYAARFFQSRLNTMALTSRSIRPGAQVDEVMARRSMLRMIGYGAIITVGTNAAMGRETDFRPVVNGRRNPNFMRIYSPIGDISVYGTWDSMLGLMINTATGNPVRAFRGVGSGLVTVGSDLIGGSDFLGRRTRDNPQQFMEWILRTFSPFAAEEAVPGLADIAKGVYKKDPAKVAGGAALVTLEVSGAKLTPRSASEERDDASITELERLLNEGALERLPGMTETAMLAAEQIAARDRPLRDLSPDIRHEVNKAPTVKKRIEQIVKEGTERGSEYRLYMNRVQEINNETSQRISQLAQGGPGRSFRDRLPELEQERADRLDERRRAAEKADVLKFLEDYQLPDDELQRDLVEYRKTAFDPLLDNPVTGEFDFERYQLRLASLQARWGERGQQRLSRVQSHMRRFDEPLENELREDREYLGEYWRTFDLVIQARGVGKLLERYEKKMDKFERVVWLKTAQGQELEDAFTEVSLRRRLMRDSDPRILELLHKWDYKPVSAEEGIEELRRRGQLVGAGQ
jgi:hypothetical protein